MPIPRRGHCFEFMCARLLTLTVPLSTQVYKWVQANLMPAVTLRWTSIHQGESRNYPSGFILLKTGKGTGLMRHLAQLVNRLCFAWWKIIKSYHSCQISSSTPDSQHPLKRTADRTRCHELVPTQKMAAFINVSQIWSWMNVAAVTSHCQVRSFSVLFWNDTISFD